MRVTTFALALTIGLAGIGCGARFAPRAQGPAEYAGSQEFRDAYTAFWWNCAIVKSIDLGAQCPASCSKTPAETAGCAAGAADAERRIGELEARHGAERTREILSLSVGEADAYSQIRSYFPYGPLTSKAQD